MIRNFSHPYAYMNDGRDPEVPAGFTFVYPDGRKESVPYKGGRPGIIAQLKAECKKRGVKHVLQNWQSCDPAYGPDYLYNTLGYSKRDAERGWG